ncbi:hypothetical protein RI129_003968 [Pyrocoelia pectoralis]|uniref:Uncharacterized protein n=1 Tax=Pyrocoelia pectoralis TaxID=417401 RepID=A0AAN7VQM4_9COLE
MYTLQKTSAEETCVKLSTSLDITRERVEHQILRYSEHLNNFDYDTCTFLSNIPIEKFDHNYQDIMSYLSLFLKEGHVVQGNDMREENLEELEIIRERIVTSHLSYIIAKNKEERLKGELEFIENAKGKDLSKSQSFDNSFQMLNESKLVAQEIMLSELHLRIESIVKKAADAIIDKPKIEMLKQLLEKESENLNLLNKVNAQTTVILAKYLLQYSLLNKEKHDIESTDSFFRKVHKYIMHNVYNSQLRTEAMAGIISKYRQYKELPLEEKLPLVNIKKELLAKNADDSTPILDLIKEFDKEYRQMEQQVFVKDFIQHRQFARILEKEVEKLQSFLIGSPTSQIIVVPHILRDTFYKISELIKMQRVASKTTLQEFNSSHKTLSERKWFKIGRQLWMWFLIEPKKVLLAINQIEAYVKQIGNK